MSCRITSSTFYMCLKTTHLARSMLYPHYPNQQTTVLALRSSRPKYLLRLNGHCICWIINRMCMAGVCVGRNQLRVCVRSSLRQGHSHWYEGLKCWHPLGGGGVESYDASVACLRIWTVKTYRCKGLRSEKGKYLLKRVLFT